MPTTSTRQVQTPNVVIQYLAIRNNSKGIIISDTQTELNTNILTYVLIDQTASQKNTNLRTIDFHSLNFIEDMNEPHMSGNLVVVDTNNVFDQLGIDSGAEIEVKLTFYDTQRNGRSSDTYMYNTITRFFSVIDIQTLNNPVGQDVIRSSGSANYVSVRFASKEAVNTDFNVYSTKSPNSQIPSHFLGPISIEELGTYGAEVPISGYGNGEFSNKPGLTIKPKTITTIDADGEPQTTPVKDEFGETIYEPKGTWDKNKHSSFFSQLIRGYNQEKPLVEREKKKFWSDPTDNEVWLKPEYYYYPSSKPANLPNISQIINYVKNYAVLKDHPDTVDFMFWEDLSGFYFKSITKLVEQEKEKHSSNPRPLFYPDPNPNNIEAIVSMEVITDIDPVSLYAQGALTSEYIRIKPYWRSPFRHILGSDDQYEKTLIKYDYNNDIGFPIIANALWPFSCYPPFNVNEILYTNSAKDFNTNNFRISEEIYGWYDTTTHNSKRMPSWNFLDSNFMGFTYTFGKIDDNSDGSLLSYKEQKQLTGRLEEEFWQAQYDFCEASAAPLHTINEIKYAQREARQNYIDAKKTNEKWKFYLENICCSRKIPSNFFALLINAKKIYGGDGTKFAQDPGGIYAYDWIEVEFWPRSSAEGLLREGQEIIKYAENETFPFILVKPRGGLEGYGSSDRTYQPKVTPPGLSEHEVGEPYKTGDTRAYNMSEILNSIGIKFTQDELAGLCADVRTAVETCKDVIMMSPGLVSPFDRAVLDEGCKTSYPDGFGMLPAGGFRYIGVCDSADETKKDPLFFGKIVQMNVIPREIMQTMVKGEQGITGFTGSERPVTISIEGQDPITFEEPPKVNIPYLFVFDSVNAHDGICDNSCAI